MTPHPLKTTDDETLARRAQDGDRTAFSELVARFEPRLSAYLNRRGLREADREDVVQETFIRAWRSLRKYDSRWRFSTWIFTIASRVGINLLKSQRRATDCHRRLATDPSIPYSTTDQTDHLANRELGGNLWDLAERLLSKDQHAAMWLRYAEDLAVRDVAHILGRSAISTRVLLHRARQRLADAVESGAVPGSVEPASTGTSTSASTSASTSTSMSGRPTGRPLHRVVSGGVT